MRWYDRGPIDGRFGAKTEASSYYGDPLLTNDGIIGRTTRARLDPPTVREGSSGQAVRLAQRPLTDYGYDPRACRRHLRPQEDQGGQAGPEALGLTVDGIVGRKSWAMLGS